MTRMLDVMIRFFRDPTGATAIEYGLIAALIGIALIAALTLVGGDLQGVYTRIAEGVVAPN